MLYSLEAQSDQAENGDKKAGEGRKIEPLRFKDIYMSFLLHLNEEFDDDLLFDSIKILDC